MFKPKITLGLWLVGLAFAFLNGAFGALVILPNFGPEANHIVKAAIGVPFLFLLLGWWHAHLTRGPDAVSAGVKTGSIWLVITALVEIPITLFVRGLSWSETMDAVARSYYIWEGQLWPLVLLALFLGPICWAYWLRNRQ